MSGLMRGRSLLPEKPDILRGRKKRGVACFSSGGGEREARCKKGKRRVRSRGEGAFRVLKKGKSGRAKMTN